MTVLQLISIFALLSIILFVSCSLVLSKKKHLHLGKVPFSNLGSEGDCGRVFNFLLFILGTSQILFVLAVGYRFQLHLSPFGIAGMMLIFITGFAGIFCSYFSQKRSQKLHSIVGAMGFAVAGPAWICLGLSLFKDFGTMAWAIVLIGIAVTGSVFFGFVRTKSLPAIYEMVFFLGILISDLIVFWMI